MFKQTIASRSRLWAFYHVTQAQLKYEGQQITYPGPGQSRLSLHRTWAAWPVSTPKLVLFLVAQETSALVALVGPNDLVHTFLKYNKLYWYLQPQEKLIKHLMKLNSLNNFVALNYNNNKENVLVQSLKTLTRLDILNDVQS